MSAVLFTTMLANILLFTFENSAGDQIANEPPLFKLGPLSVSSFSVTMGILGALITVPVNMLVLTFFTARKHYVSKYPNNQTTDKYRTNSKKLNDSVITNEIELMEFDDLDDEEKDKGCVRYSLYFCK